LSIHSSLYKKNINFLNYKYDYNQIAELNTVFVIVTDNANLALLSIYINFEYNSYKLSLCLEIRSKSKTRR